MKTARIAMTLLLLTVAGCAQLGATGGANSPGSRAAAPQTIVRYHVAGFGAAKAGDYLAAPVTMDEFFASGTNTVAGATGSFDSLLATVFHRGRVFSLVSPTKPWAPFDLLVVEQGRILTTIPDGACKLSLSVDRPVEPERETPVAAPACEAGTGSSTNRLSLEIVVGECEPALRERLPATTSQRLSPAELAHHNPTNSLLVQRFTLPAKGRLTQDLKGDEFTIHLDLDYQYWTEKNAVNGGVSASSAASHGLLRPVHWNCFSVTMGEPLYLGYVKTGRATYLIVGRFRLATTTVPATEEKR